MPYVPHGCLVGCSGAANDFNWRLVNGLWGFILAVGLLWTSLTVRQARSWLYFKGWARSFLADYGVPLLVVIWSAVGYCVNSGTPSGIPRRTRIPNTWDEKTNWTVARVCMQLMGSFSIPHAGTLHALLSVCAPLSIYVKSKACLKNITVKAQGIISP